MLTISAIRVVAPYAPECALGNIGIGHGPVPSLIFYTQRASKQHAAVASAVATFYEQYYEPRYPRSAITFERGSRLEGTSRVVLAGELVEDTVRDVVELSQCTAPFWAKPLIALEFDLLRTFYNRNIPKLRNAPADGAKLIIQEYQNLAWLIANGYVPQRG